MKTQLLMILLITVSMQAVAQKPQTTFEGIQQQWQQPLSKQFTQQIIQAPSGNRDLVQVYDSIYNWDWNEVSQQWDLALRHIDLQMDDNYNVVGSTDQVWTGTSWENSAMTSMAITDAGLTFTSTRQIWINNTYVNEQRMITQTQFPAWYQTTVTIQNWIDGDWMNQYQYLLSNTDEGPLGYEINKEWIDGEWVNTALFEYSYDDIWAVNPKLSGILISEWMNSEWMQIVRYSMTYYPDNNMSGQLEEFYIENMWVNSTKDTLYTYNDLGSVTGFTRYFWTGEDWMNFYKIENTYDDQNNPISNRVFQWMNFWSLVSTDISKYSYDEDMFIAGESILNYQGAGSDAIAGDSTNYIYHTVITGSWQLPSADAGIAVWPNPGRDVFTISSNEVIKEMEVFDLSGHRISALQSATQLATTLDLTDVPKGVYILRLHTANSIRHSKIIRQ